MPGETKTEQLQVRVSKAQKAAIRRQARRAGISMSDWLLRRALPPALEHFQQLVGAVADAATPGFALAELNEALDRWTADELAAATEEAPRVSLSPYLENYVAAMVEVAAAHRQVAPPAWTGSVEPLRQPAFGSDLVSLRLHLLTHSPPPFRARNIFIDSSVGDRV